MSTSFSHSVSGTGPAAGMTFTGRTNIGTDGVTLAGSPLVVALHGGTYTSEYFDIPGHSLLDRASEEGVPVIALDRPSYVGSSPLESEGSIILANAEVVSDAIGSIWEEYGGQAAGVVLLAHSIGGAVATAIAADQPTWPLLGLATSGCFVKVPEQSRAAWEALPPIAMIELPTPMKDQVMFGPEGTYADDMPAASHPSNTLVPKTELLDITGDWIANRSGKCAQITVPVHHRMGEFDRLWLVDETDLADYAAGFTAAPSVDAQIVTGSGHCIDFHLPGEEFQRSQLSFARQVAQTAPASA